jgi:serine/threonine protein kinase/formylglycine-generating enzyme required for sulfatase activity
MGEVHLAHDTLLDRAVAVKFIAGVTPDAGRRRRFFAEARAIARLQHPNVVTVYRVGEVRDRPYLVSEFLRGETLERLRKPVAWERALAIGIGLSRGLAAAHRHNVLHRDLKPANAILADDGEAKLLDFGLAKLVDYAAVADVALASGESFVDTLPPTLSSATPLKATRSIPDRTETADGARRTALGPALPISLTATGGIVGTPLYMAPELWRAEPASRRSDVYSLGLILYELCAGRVPRRDLPVEEFRAALQNEAIRPLMQAAPGVDSRFGAVVDRCLERDPARRFESADALREALESLAVHAPTSAVTAGKPYRGLHPFEPEHRNLFFGRASETRALLDRLRAEPFLLVAGDSGVGKSSLCRAGLLPLVAEGVLGDGLSWSIATMVPGRRPLAALAATLAPLVDDDEATLARLFVDEPSSWARHLSHRGERRGTLLFIDQLEELLTLAYPDEAAAAAETLGAFIQEAGVGRSLRLLATVRGDFLTKIATRPGLGPEVARALHVLGPPSEAALRQAVVEPAAAFGYRFESEALCDSLVGTAARAEGGLPLLQFALSELWEARDQHRREITAASLAATGGVEGALARHADRVLASLLPSQRVAAQRLLLRLVTVEGTRERRGENELLAAESNETKDDARKALETLVRGRLIVARDVENSGEGTYELAHEALVSSWETLREWLRSDANRHAARKRLERAAAEWKQLGKAREALWVDRRLVEAESLADEGLSPGEAQFVEESRRARRRRQFLRLAAILALPLTSLAVWGAVKLSARRDLNQRIAARLQEADALLDHVGRGNSEVEQLRTQSFARFDAADIATGRKLWKQALAQSVEVERDCGGATQALEAALLMDPTRTNVHRRFAAALYARAELAERDRRTSERDEFVRRMSSYDTDGKLVRRWQAPARVSIVTSPAGAEVLLGRYDDQDGKLILSPGRGLGVTPLSEVELPPGSYLLTLSIRERPPVRYPLLLSRGEDYRVELELPAGVPEGMVYIPAGRFLYGCGDVERICDLLKTDPLHQIHTSAYLMRRTETTYEEWLEFLHALPARERDAHRPRVDNRYGALDVAQLVNGEWQLSLQPVSYLYRALKGELLHYADRTRRTDQNWLRFPVAGISWDDARAYLAWLRRSGRLPGARLCTEYEWERAARGADGRLYPSGDGLEPDDANHDVTYGRKPRAFGPDEVGSHPASDSPFGIADLVGNVSEWTESAHSPEEVIFRGGSYYQSFAVARGDNRQVGERTQRSALIGLRVCAPISRAAGP